VSRGTEIDIGIGIGIDARATRVRIGIVTIGPSSIDIPLVGTTGPVDSQREVNQYVPLAKRGNCYLVGSIGCRNLADCTETGATIGGLPDAQFAAGRVGPGE